MLTLEGRFHRLDSELRGWGQRDFPHYHHTVEPDAIDMPVTERLIGELVTVLRAHGLGDTDHQRISGRATGTLSPNLEEPRTDHATRSDRRTRSSRIAIVSDAYGAAARRAEG